jgi:hypothetical protein
MAGRQGRKSPRRNDREHMSELTPEQFEQAKDIIEKYRDCLFRTKWMNAHSFEREIRELWQLGYQDIKELIEELSHHGRCEQVAVYYMEHSNGGRVVSEFQGRLAEIYGIDWYYADDRPAKQAAYWERTFADHV